MMRAVQDVAQLPELKETVQDTEPAPLPVASTVKGQLLLVTLHVRYPGLPEEELGKSPSAAVPLTSL